jgi:hypothetical protein
MSCKESELILENDLIVGYTADRGSFPPREDLPLPTSPPYTAFIGNLAFDVTEVELEGFFSGTKVRSNI